MAKWSLSSYNRFLGESMTRYGLTRSQAAESYRAMREKLDRPVFRTDLKAHPIIAKRAAERGISRRPPREIPGPPAKPPEGVEIPEEILEEELDFDQEAESSEDYE